MQLFPIWSNTQKNFILVSRFFRWFWAAGPQRFLGSKNLCSPSSRTPNTWPTWTRTRSSPSELPIRPVSSTTSRISEITKKRYFSFFFSYSKLNQFKHNCIRSFQHSFFRLTLYGILCPHLWLDVNYFLLNEQARLPKRTNCWTILCINILTAYHQYTDAILKLSIYYFDLKYCGLDLYLTR